MMIGGEQKKLDWCLFPGGSKINDFVLLQILNIQLSKFRFKEGLKLV